MREELIKWLESNMGTCPYNYYFGIDCPGCGMQRAAIELIKGNVLESLQLYPALIPTIVMFVFLIFHIFLKFKDGATILKYLFFFTVSIVVISYIVKIIQNQI
ncbi:MAG: DUF2752 domain-containing protein [Bacteroidales bacterium]|nr:DUF2752 domain-containing protein [Bacteroidales bacterium]